MKRGYTSKQAIGSMNTELQGSIASSDEFSDVVEIASQMTARTKKAVNSLAYSSDVTSTSFQSLGIGMSYVFSNCTSNRIQFDGNGKCNGRFEKQWFGSGQGFGKTGRLARNCFAKQPC